MAAQPPLAVPPAAAVPLPPAAKVLNFRVQGIPLPADEEFTNDLSAADDQRQFCGSVWGVWYSFLRGSLRVYVRVQEVRACGLMPRIRAVLYLQNAGFACSSAADSHAACVQRRSGIWGSLFPAPPRQSPTHAEAHLPLCLPLSQLPARLRVNVRPSFFLVPADASSEAPAPRWADPHGLYVSTPRTCTFECSCRRCPPVSPLMLFSQTCCRV